MDVWTILTAISLEIFVGSFELSSYGRNSVGTGPMTFNEGFIY